MLPLVLTAPPSPRNTWNHHVQKHSTHLQAPSSPSSSYATPSYPSSDDPPPLPKSYSRILANTFLRESRTYHLGYAFGSLLNGWNDSQYALGERVAARVELRQVDLRSCSIGVGGLPYADTAVQRLLREAESLLGERWEGMSPTDTEMDYTPGHAFDERFDFRRPSRTHPGGGVYRPERAFVARCKCWQHSVALASVAVEAFGERQDTRASLEIWVDEQRWRALARLLVGQPDTEADTLQNEHSQEPVLLGPKEIARRLCLHADHGACLHVDHDANPIDVPPQAQADQVQANEAYSHLPPEWAAALASAPFTVSIPRCSRPPADLRAPPPPPEIDLAAEMTQDELEQALSIPPLNNLSHNNPVGDISWASLTPSPATIEDAARSLLAQDERGSAARAISRAVAFATSTAEAGQGRVAVAVAGTRMARVVAVDVNVVAVELAPDEDNELGLPAGSEHVDEDIVFAMDGAIAPPPTPTSLPSPASTPTSSTPALTPTRTPPASTRPTTPPSSHSSPPILTAPVSLRALLASDSLFDRVPHDLLAPAVGDDRVDAAHLLLDGCGTGLKAAPRFGFADVFSNPRSFPEALLPMNSGPQWPHTPEDEMSSTVSEVSHTSLSIQPSISSADLCPPEDLDHCTHPSALGLELELALPRQHQDLHSPQPLRPYTPRLPGTPDTPWEDTYLSLTHAPPSRASPTSSSPPSPCLEPVSASSPSSPRLEYRAFRLPRAPTPPPAPRSGFVSLPASAWTSRAPSVASPSPTVSRENLAMSPVPARERSRSRGREVGRSWLSREASLIPSSRSRSRARSTSRSRSKSSSTPKERRERARSRSAEGRWSTEAIAGSDPPSTTSTTYLASAVSTKYPSAASSRAPTPPPPPPTPMCSHIPCVRAIAARATPTLESVQRFYDVLAASVFALDRRRSACLASAPIGAVRGPLADEVRAVARAARRREKAHQAQQAQKLEEQAVADGEMTADEQERAKSRRIQIRRHSEVIRTKDEKALPTPPNSFASWFGFFRSRPGSEPSSTPPSPPPSKGMPSPVPVPASVPAPPIVTAAHVSTGMVDGSASTRTGIPEPGLPAPLQPRSILLPPRQAERQTSYLPTPSSGEGQEEEEEGERLGKESRAAAYEPLLAALEGAGVSVVVVHPAFMDLLVREVAGL